MAVLAVLAGGVGAVVAAGSPALHVREGRVVVAVGAEDEALALHAGGEVQDLKVIKGAPGKIEA